MQEREYIPKITIALIVANIVMFVITEIFGSSENTEILIKCGAMYTPYVEAGQYWRLFSAMFLHSGIRHLLNNIITLYVMGYILEAEIGRVKYLILYLAGGLCGNLVELWWSGSRGENVVAVGASGAIFAIIGALVWVLIVNKGRVRGLTMPKMIVLIAFSLYFGLVAANVANAAHLGGMGAGFVLAIILHTIL